MRRDLRTRLVLGPSMLALVALVYWIDTTVLAERGMRGFASAAVLGLLAVGGVAEYGAMLRKGGFAVAGRWLLVVTIAQCASAFWFDWRTLGHPLYPVVASAFAISYPVALAALAPRRVAEWLPTLGATLLGLVLIAWPMYLAQGLAILHLPSVLFVVLVCKFGDIGAYFVGVAIGRHKLIPHVSPGKTIEGSTGGMVTSCIVAAVAAPRLLPPELELGLFGSLGLGIALNLTTQTGDLIESQLKRSCGAKDSSNLLPAHGGILDLIDSLVFSFPVHFLVLALAT